MHVLVPIHAFEPGGVERVGLRLAERWRAEGHEVTILLGRDRGLCRDQRPELTFCRFPEPFSTAGWETVWMMVCLVRYLLRRRVDVIFCPGLTYTAPCVIAKLLLGPRCPPVLVKVSNDLDRRGIGRLLHWPYRAWLWAQGRLLDEFVAIGPPMREPVARALRIESKRVSVLPDPALAQAQIEELSRPHDKEKNDQEKNPGRRFLAVGRLVPQKNFALLVEAFAHLATPEDRLVIAGEGPGRAALERRISRLGLTAQVRLPGHVSDVAQLYRNSNALVLSSNYEGVPGVVIEALAAGLPIAATLCCESMGWLLGEGRYGALAPCGDAAALACAMEQACGHEMQHAELAAFVSTFTLERAAGDYLALLARISASPGRSAKNAAPDAGTDSPRRLAARSAQQGQRMSNQILLPVSGDEISLLPQDRHPTFNWTRVLTIVLSLLVIAAALYQMRTIEPERIFRLVPASPSFWLLFLLGFMAGPLSEWYIFNRLWGVGLPALGALTRKLVFNELLFGYLGEAYFYAWARKNRQVEAAPFGAVKDVAILSAMAGNLMTLAMIALAIPFLDLLPLGDHRAAIGWSLAFVVGTSLAATVWRKSLFSLTASELRMVVGVHMARILATTLISATLWFLVLPDTPIGWWLVLAAIRLLISRLPFVPNKDVVFAGIAVLMAGANQDIAELMAMMAGLILAANLIAGCAFAVIDLMTGERRLAPAR